MSKAISGNVLLPAAFLFRGIEHPMVETAREQLFASGSLDLGRRFNPGEIQMIERVLQPLWAVSTLSEDDEHLVFMVGRWWHGFKSLPLPDIIGQNQFMRLRAWIGPRLSEETGVPECHMHADVYVRAYRSVCEHLAMLILSPADVRRL